MVDIVMPEHEERNPIIDVLLIIITAGFSVTAVVYAAESFVKAFIPLTCALMFFVMFMATKGVIGGK